MRMPQIVNRGSRDDDLSIALDGFKSCSIDRSAQDSPADIPMVVRRPLARQEHEILIA